MKMLEKEIWKSFSFTNTLLTDFCLQMLHKKFSILRVYVGTLSFYYENIKENFFQVVHFTNIIYFLFLSKKIEHKYRRQKMLLKLTKGFVTNRSWLLSLTFLWMWSNLDWKVKVFFSKKHQVFCGKLALHKLKRLMFSKIIKASTNKVKSSCLSYLTFH